MVAIGLVTVSPTQASLTVCPYLTRAQTGLFHSLFFTVSEEEMRLPAISWMGTRPREVKPEAGTM